MRQDLCIILLAMIATITTISGSTQEPLLNPLASNVTATSLKTYLTTLSARPVLHGTAYSHNELRAFYEGQKSSWVSYILKQIGLVRPRFGSPYSFRELITAVATKQLIKTNKEDKVAYLPCSPDTTFVVWGNLQSAAPTLVHSLIWLYEQGILNHDLTIAKKNYYFIFNGNAIGHDLYSFETLSLIFLLMERNPNHIIYLCGLHEYEQYWNNLPIKEQIMAQGEASATYLQNMLTQFCATLPLALYVSISGRVTDLLCFTFGSIQDVGIDEKQLGPLFTAAQEGSIMYQNIQKSGKTLQPVDIKARVVTAQNITDSRAHSGLGFMDPYEGAMNWGVLAHQFELPRNPLDPVHESFVVISCTESLDKSTISLYEYAAIDHTFKESGPYYIIGGYPKKGFPDGTQRELISIGSSVALVQGVPVMGQLVKRGASIAINETNQAGGINGNIIRFTVYNDDYIPYIARENIRKLSAEGSDIILAPVGSPTLNAYLDEIRENKVLVLFPITGAPAFRQPSLKNIIHLRGQYSDEVYALLSNLMQNYNVKKFAFFYQDDAYGIGPLEAAITFLKTQGITEYVKVPYSRANTDFRVQAKAILEAQPEAIGFFATAQAGEALIREIGIENCVARKLFGISFFAEETFRRFAQRHGIPVMYGAVVPNPRTSQLPIAREYRQAMDTISKQYDVFSFEAYVGASLLIDILHQIAPPFTREKIAARLEQLKQYTFKGLSLTFNPATLSLAQHIWIETGSHQEWPAINLDSLSLPAELRSSSR